MLVQNELLYFKVARNAAQSEYQTLTYFSPIYFYMQEFQTPEDILPPGETQHVEEEEEEEPEVRNYDLPATLYCLLFIKLIFSLVSS